MRGEIQTRVGLVEDKGEAAKNMVVSLMQGPVLLQLMASAISKKFYTTLAGVDYMVGTIVEARRFEKMLLEKKRVPQRKGCCGCRCALLRNALLSCTASQRTTVGPGGSNVVQCRVPEENRHDDVEAADGGGGGGQHDIKPTVDEPTARRCWCCCKKKNGVGAQPAAVSPADELQAVVADRNRRLDDLVRVMDVDEDEGFRFRKNTGISAAQNLGTLG